MYEAGKNGRGLVIERRTFALHTTSDFLRLGGSQYFANVLPSTLFEMRDSILVRLMKTKMLNDGDDQRKRMKKNKGETVKTPPLFIYSMHCIAT